MKKEERKKRIRNFLRMQSDAKSISEIHDAVSKRMNLDISRKTIERDILQFVDEGEVHILDGVPSRYELICKTQYHIVLNHEELQFILRLLNNNLPLFQKLNKFLDY